MKIHQIKKAGDNVRISKYKNIFTKGYTPNWSFLKRIAKKLIKKILEYKKHLKEKVINYMSNGKDIIIHLIVGLIKMI